MGDILDLTEEQMDDVPVLKLAEVNEEYQIKIISIIKGTDKNDTEYLMPFFEVADDPNIEEFSKYLPLPDDEMSEKNRNRAKRDLNDFADCFGFSWTSRVELDDLKGETGWAILGRSKDDAEYGIQNTIKKFIAPK